jgi:hypothetical protein
MGSAASGYKAAFIARYGEQKWQERSEEYSAIWRAIRDGVDQVIKQRATALSQVKLYQDSLPVCGQEAALVEQLAAEGSENHKLLTILMGRGALLIGTEAPKCPLINN